MIFGTSRHLSVGTFAIVCIMIASTINKLEDQLAGGILVDGNNTNITDYSNNSTNSSTQITDEILLVRVRIAISLAFWTGIVQVYAKLNVRNIFENKRNCLLIDCSVNISSRQCVKISFSIAIK